MPVVCGGGADLGPDGVHCPSGAHSSSEQPLFLWLPHKGHNPISSVGYHRE